MSSKLPQEAGAESALLSFDSPASAPRRRAPTPKLKPTLDGAVFALIAAAVGFAAFNTGASLLYLIFSMMLSLFVVSGFAASRTLRGLEVRRRLGERVFANRPASIGLEIRNSKRLFASYSLRLSDKMAAEGELGPSAGAAFIFALAPRGHETVFYKAVFPKRGRQELAAVEVATRYPFGFLERRLALPLAESFIVYPEVRGIVDPRSAAFNRPGESERQERGEGIDLRSLRDYSDGDSAKKIVWKISARVNRLIVAETERETDVRRRFALDHRLRGPAMPWMRERFELAVSFLASAAVHFARRGETVSIHTPGGAMTASGGSGLDRLLKALALIELRENVEDAATGRWAPPEAIQILWGSESAAQSVEGLPFAEWSALLAPREGSLEGPPV
jgi:uncharacterized protein (DUF58 family)